MDQYFRNLIVDNFTANIVKLPLIFQFFVTLNFYETGQNCNIRFPRLVFSRSLEYISAIF